MYKILSSKASCDSAMKFRDALEKVLGMKPKTILVSQDSGACRGHTVLMRYGCGYGEVHQKTPEWGSRDFVRMCIDKNAFANFFREFAKTPEFHMTGVPTQFPVMIRDTLTGSQSQGVHVVHNASEFRRHWATGKAWTRFYDDKTFELRVLVALHKKAIEVRIYKKVPTGSVTVTNEDFVVEGENTTWSLRDPKDYQKNYPKVLKIVENMATPMWKAGGRFVGLDLIYVPSLKDYVVLEGNSGPWLSLGAAQWLAGIFAENLFNLYK